MKFFLSHLAFPLGAMLLVADEQGRVLALEIGDRRSRLHRSLREQYGTYELLDAEAPAAVATAMRRYFAGELQALDELDVVTAGSERQQRAWAALRRIPAGTTATYGEIGQAMGITDWRASVDAGAAVGANPVALIVPCHRVVGANGDLKGFAWGLHRKQWLLEHEGAIKPRRSAAQTEALF